MVAWTPCAVSSEAVEEFGMRGRRPAERHRRAHGSTDPRETTMASNTEKTSPPAFGEGLRPTGTSLDPGARPPGARPDDGRVGMLPSAAAPRRTADPQRRVPRACGPRRSRTMWRATRRRARVRPARQGPARGLPRSVVAVERSERPATSPPPGLGQPCWRRAVSSARRASTERTHRPPSRESQDRPWHRRQHS